jgi:hypothetical protein
MERRARRRESERRCAGRFARGREAEKRGELIRHLEEALALANEIEDAHTGFLIERAIDGARSRQFRPAG